MLLGVLFPLHFCSSDLGSNRSIWLGPPFCMKCTTALARGGECPPPRRRAFGGGEPPPAPRPRSEVPAPRPQVLRDRRPQRGAALLLEQAGQRQATEPEAGGVQEVPAG